MYVINSVLKKLKNKKIIIPAGNSRDPGNFDFFSCCPGKCPGICILYFDYVRWAMVSDRLKYISFKFIQNPNKLSYSLNYTIIIFLQGIDHDYSSYLTIMIFPLYLLCRHRKVIERSFHFSRCVLFCRCLYEQPFNENCANSNKKRNICEKSGKYENIKKSESQIIRDGGQVVWFGTVSESKKWNK